MDRGENWAHVSIARLCHLRLCAILTFGVHIVRSVEVLQHTVLANDLFNLALGIDVEGVLVQQLDLTLLLAACLLLVALHLGEGSSPLDRVVDEGSKVGPLPGKLFQVGRAAQELLSHILWVQGWHAALGLGLAGLTRTRLWLATSMLADMHSHHFVIPDAGLLQCLTVIAQRHPVVEQNLGLGGAVWILGFDEGLEVSQGQVGGQIEGDERLVRLAGRGD